MSVKRFVKKNLIRIWLVLYVVTSVELRVDLKLPQHMAQSLLDFATFSLFKVILQRPWQVFKNTYSIPDPVLISVTEFLYHL